MVFLGKIRHIIAINYDKFGLPLARILFSTGRGLLVENLRTNAE